MAIAKKCDRCGELYEEYNVINSVKNINGIMTLNIDDRQKHYSHGPYDLCPACSDELMKWFRKERKTQ